MIKSLFNDRNHYRLRHKPGAKLLFFNHTDRLDHMQSFQKVISLVPNEDVAQVDVSAGRFARPGKILRRVGQLLRWLKNFRKSGLTWREFCFVIPFAQLAQEAKEQFEQWDLSYYRAVIFYYDFNWVSNVLLQICLLYTSSKWQEYRQLLMCMMIFTHYDSFGFLQFTG